MANALFANLGTADTEKTDDRVGGGGFTALDTDIYSGTIKMAYAMKSAKGANGIVLIATGGDFGDREYRETLWITNAKGENFYKTAKGGDKKYQLPGFIVANHLAQIVAGVELNGLQFEDKVVKIYDFEQSKEVPTSVPVAVDLIGQEVSFAIQNTLEFQTEKSGDAYVPKADGSTRNTNSIVKVLHTPSHMTVHEAQAKQEDPNVVAEFWDSWLEKNKGQVYDKTKKGVANAVQNGRPGGAPQGGGTPAGGNAGGGERKSLFG